MIVASAAHLELGGAGPQQRAVQPGRESALDRQHVDDDLVLQAGESEVIRRAIRSGVHMTPPVRKSLIDFTFHTSLRPSRKGRCLERVSAANSLKALTRAVRRRSSWVSTHSAVAISGTGSPHRTRTGERSPR